MKNSDIHNSLFREAVEAIDAGNITKLKQLLQEHSHLVHERLDVPKEGYFQHPYLLWFVGDNPIRHAKLPANIVEVTGIIIDTLKNNPADTNQYQLDYTLGLVATGSTPRECGVQLELIDLLIDNGAIPGDGQGALAHGNMEAAKHIITRSGKLTLTAAICLDRIDDIKRLLPEATSPDKQAGLMAAAFYGKPEIIKLLIQTGIDVSAYIETGFHTHASALHQAVYSGSLDAVKILIEAGGNLDAKDRVYHGTPLGWAIYMQTEEGHSEEEKRRFTEIESFLKKTS